MHSRGVLRVVGNTCIDDGTFDLLAVRAGKSAVFKAQEREEISVPLIGLKCASYYHPLGALMYAGEDYGFQPAVLLDVIWRGRKITLTGPAVIIEDELGIILPNGVLP